LPLPDQQALPGRRQPRFNGDHEVHQVERAGRFPHRIRRDDSSPASIRTAVEGSLRRLGTDYIDLYYQHRVSALDAAAEVAWDRDMSAEDRDRAVAIMCSALELTPKPDPGSLLREAQNLLTVARGEADPHRRREQARSALAKAREAMRHRDVDNHERAQARQVIGAGRMLVNTGGGGRDTSANR
jgi:hypothetical protein